MPILWTQNHCRKVCPARRHKCGFCRFRGHFNSVCEHKLDQSADIAVPCCIAATPVIPALARTTVPVKVNGTIFYGLADTGSSESFISQVAAQQLKLAMKPYTKTISLASSSCVQTAGTVPVSLQIEGHVYKDLRLSVLPGLCNDILIGHDLLSQHRRLVVEFEGHKSDMLLPNKVSFCNLAEAIISPPSLFANLSNDCHPIACKSRTYSSPDQKFISGHLGHLGTSTRDQPPHFMHVADRA